MSSPQHIYLNAFNLLPQIGPVRMRKILARFPSLEVAWKAPLSEFLAAGLDEKVAQGIVGKRAEIDPELEYARLEKEGVRIISHTDDDYPALLCEISSAPVILYAKGELKRKEPSLGIVGSRKLSDYGKRAAEDFSRALAGHGITLVSGMAYGADTIAHHECLKQSRRTIAVLGSGLDEKSIYPSSNRPLAERIAEIGCVISEFPLGMPPLRQNFPARNRLISGLSRGLLVIEASATSGSLITARFALEQNREVFAVPGSIYAKNSEGTNNLIRMGAKSACKISDILEEFNLELDPAVKEARRILPESEEEALVIGALSPEEPLHVDKISHATGIRTAALSSILTVMEMKGMVKNIGGMRYVSK